MNLSHRLAKTLPLARHIRELQNVLTQAVIRARGHFISAQELCLSIPEVDHRCDPNAMPTAGGQPMTLAELEAKHIQYVLDYTAGCNACALSHFTCSGIPVYFYCWHKAHGKMGCAIPVRG